MDVAAVVSPCKWLSARTVTRAVSRVVVSGGSAGATNSVAAGVTFDGDYRDELTVSEDRTLASTNLGYTDTVTRLTIPCPCMLLLFIK